jgi:hypothetical protein
MQSLVRNVFLGFMLVISIGLARVYAQEDGDDERGAVRMCVDAGCAAAMPPGSGACRPLTATKCSCVALPVTNPLPVVAYCHTYW